MFCMVLNLSHGWCNCKSLAGCLLGWLQVWYSNVPYDDLASYKADQNWVKKKSDKLEFPGGGTQFKNGVGQYIEYLERVGSLFALLCASL